jgi:hypothetical protein
MRQSTETLNHPENTSTDNKNNFRLNKITVEHGRRSKSNGEMIPFNLGLNDGRDSELYVGINPHNVSPSVSKQYETFIAALPTAQPEQTAAMMYEAYDMINKTGESIPQPAAFLVGKDGEVAWSADANSDTTGLVLVRGDGTVERLGAGDEKYGVIDDVSAKDMLYMAPNTLISTMQATDQLDKDGLKEAYLDTEEKHAVMRVRFNEAVLDTPADHVLARTTKNLKNHGERHRTDAASSKGRHVKQPDTATQSPDAHTKPLDQAAKTGDTQDDEPESLGFSEMVRLAAQVEKYTQKVASYEDLATEALARRMKGRLFKAPQYKTQGEKAAAEQALKDSGKEKTFGTKLSQAKEKALDKLQGKSKKDAKLDDDYMYLLEGFSRALDGALMKQWLAEGHSDEEVSKMLYEHQQTRQEARAARNHAELRKGKMASFLDKYANMPKGKRIAITIGAAGVVGAVGLVAGGALGVAGAVGLAGAKVGKAYLQQRSKLYEEKRDESMPGPDRAVSVANGKVSTNMTAAERVFAGRKYDQAKREKAIKDADRNKKLAVGVAAVSAVLLGAGVAGKIAEHADDIQKFWSKPLMPNIPTEVGNADGDWVTQRPEVQPTGASLESITSTAAETINFGEGWLQTFAEAGITDPAQQYALLNNQALMQELANKGLAYQDANIGGWGITMTPDQKMPADALSLIRDYANRSGYSLAS